MPNLPTINNFSSFLNSATKILEHQKELIRVKGESFNLFSILKMESKENSTHSAFLGELLNPKGSHLLGDVFLRLFLKEIDLEDYLDNTAYVHLEKHLGKVDLTKKEGGRLDVLLEDQQGNSITIENKIYAGDQESQIERYCNYNKERNKVFYLTLNGEEPTNISKGKLTPGENFYTLSYKETILNWLEACQKEATDIPMLRESIKQYILLLKKLTNTMDTKHQEELTQLMIQNFEAAKYVADNLKWVKRKLGDQLRALVFNKLGELIDKEFFDIVIGVPYEENRKYMQIFIQSKVPTSPLLWIGVESFSGEGWANGTLFVGVFAYNGGAKIDGKNKLNGWWPHHEIIPEFKGEWISMSNEKILQNLVNDPIYKEELADHITQYVFEFVKAETEMLTKK